jgi:hypothetical protein
MLTTAKALMGPRPPRWSMTSAMLSTLETDANRLATEADHSDGYITAFFEGEPDAPSLVPNVPGQRLVHQLTSVRRALSTAQVEADAGLAVIGRRVTLEEADGTRTSYTLTIPGEGDPQHGWVSVSSPVGSAIYLGRVGDVVAVEAPAGRWTATVVAVE